MAVVMFPIAGGDFCFACGRPMKAHGARCRQDIVVGQDQQTVARRVRVARLQIGRGLKMRALKHRVESVQ